MGRTRMLRLPALCAVLLGVLTTHEAGAHGEQESCPAGWTASQCAVMHRHAHMQSCPQGWSEATCRGYVARHGGGTSTGTTTTTRRLTAKEHLRTKRFRTHQPKVLEQIGAHHAYAKGLTGRGVRIGIEDSVVDYTQRNEFGNRVKTTGHEGAQLYYWRPLTFGWEIDACIDRKTCDGWVGNSEQVDDFHNAAVRHIVEKETGWPRPGRRVYIEDNAFPDDDSLLAFWHTWEVPSPYGNENHGTAVASVAAGRNFGVAPQATIIPRATDLSPSQAEISAAETEFKWAIITSPVNERQWWDRQLTKVTREYWRKFDIVNRSYGSGISLEQAYYTLDEDLWYQRWLPRYRRAEFQMDTPDHRKTIVVYAAGNAPQGQAPEPVPGLGGFRPWLFEEARGHEITVAATDPRTGRIASWSYRCGPLPNNWNKQRHGRHYCLSAPGIVRGLVTNANSPGRGTHASGITGTSFAAPVVSGALALMMEHFRGTIGNTRIVRRMLDTADRSGVYANSLIYGAGHLDLEAALSPVGARTAGQDAAPLGASRLSTPAAFGAVGARLNATEVATFDSQGFPFWIPASSLVTSGSSARSPIPGIEAEPAAPGAGMDALGQYWTSTGANRADTGALTLGFGPTSASIAKAAHGGGWGWGASFAHDEYLGGRAGGAFGDSLHSGLVWTSKSFKQDMGGGATLEAGITLATGTADYQAGGMFEATPSLMSAAKVRFGNADTSITVEQPMRAETGTGTFHLETGHAGKDGRRARAAHRVPLRPDAREVRATFRHEGTLGAGRIAFEASAAMDAGHVEGAHDASIGVAWQVRF